MYVFLQTLPTVPKLFMFFFTFVTFAILVVFENGSDNRNLENVASWKDLYFAIKHKKKLSPTELYYLCNEKLQRCFLRLGSDLCWQVLSELELF